MVLMTSWAKPSEHSRIWHAEGEEAQMTNKKAGETCTLMQPDKYIDMQAKYTLTPRKMEHCVKLKNRKLYLQIISVSHLY